MKGLLLLAVASVAMVSAQAPTENMQQGCVTNYNADYDYFPQKLNTVEDEGDFFSISYHKNYKLVKNERNGHNYILVQCGTPTPADIPSDALVYQIPVTKAAAMETTVVPYLEMLGVAETLDVIADGSLVSSPCFQKYYNSKEIVQLSTTNQTLQEEQLKGIDVQFGINPFETTTTSNSVSTSSVHEPDVLGRASWISYYAAFYNREATANKVMETMVTNYNNLAKASAKYEVKPVVAWATYDAPNQYNDNTASYLLSNSSYKLNVVKDAGGVVLSSPVLKFSSAEEFLKVLSEVDILIDETYIGVDYASFLESYKLTEADTENYRFMKNKAVFREDGILSTAGGFDWFEAPVAMADALLEDVINAINPSAPTAGFQRRWLRNIALNEPIKYSTEANCTWDTTQPRPNYAVAFDGGDFSLSGASALTSVTALLVATVFFNMLFI